MEIWGECRILFTKETKSFQIQLNAYCVTDDRIDAETAEVTLRTKVLWDMKKLLNYGSGNQMSCTFGWMDKEH